MYNKSKKIFTAQGLQSVFRKFNQMRVLVIGDSMLDVYWEGNTNRISPEAPVPVVDIKNTDEKPGGAANVALNLVALGAKVALAGITGKDKEASVLRKLLGEKNIDISCLLEIKNRPTTTKTRVLSHHHQLIRIDREETGYLKDNEKSLFLNRLQKLLDSFKPQVIIFEDYDKGLLEPVLINFVTSLANELDIPVCVDPKNKNFMHYRQCDLFKPNLREIREGLKLPVDDSLKGLKEAHLKLENILHHKKTMITLSEKGLFYGEKNNYGIIPAHIRNIADVSGAGDTVISVAALCLTAGCNLQAISAIANIAGGMTCEKPGVTAIPRAELLKECIKLLT